MIKDLLSIGIRVIVTCLGVGLLVAYGLWPFVESGWSTVVEIASEGLERIPRPTLP